MTEQEIIDKAVEKALLMMPEVVGNLMAHNATVHKLNSSFYKEHPEFSKRKDVVASVVEQVEGQNPLADYKDILRMAVPEIKKRLTLTDSLNMEVPSMVDRNLKTLNLMNGEI